MWLDIAISCIGVLLLGNYALRRSVLYPPFLFCLMWFIDLSIYRMDLIEIDPLHTYTLTLIIVGALLFSLGGVFAFLVPTRVISARLSLAGRRVFEAARMPHKWAKYLLVLLLIFVLAAQIRNLLSFAAQGGGIGSGLLMNARKAQVEDINEKGSVRNFLTYLGPWPIFAAVLFQVEGYDRLFKFAVALAFLSCIIGTGRVDFLFLLSSLTCVHLIKKRRETFINASRFVRWPILIFISLFFIVLFTVKDNSGVQSGLVSFAGESLVQYIIGPTGALDYVLQHPNEYVGLPNHTFKTFLSLASALGLTNYTPPPALDAFLFIPFSTNVYTVYKFYFTDFGPYMTAIIMAILGFGHTLLYRKAHTKSPLGMYLFALTIFTVLMVTFDDWYVAYGRYVNAVVFGMAYFALRRLPLGISFRGKKQMELASE